MIEGRGDECRRRMVYAVVQVESESAGVVRMNSMTRRVAYIPEVAFVWLYDCFIYIGLVV